MEQTQKLMTVLNSTQAIETAGFLSGFMYGLKFDKSTLEHPLATIFQSSINGSIMAWCAGFVAEYLPERLRFFIPVTIAASIVYWKYNDVKVPLMPSLVSINVSTSTTNQTGNTNQTSDTTQN